MGCDIHCVVERRRAGSQRWLGLYCTDFLPKRPLFAERDYAFFAELAGVRGRSETGATVRGLPRDISELAWEMFSECPTDHHTPNHMPLAEFTARFVRVLRANEPKLAERVREEYATYDLFRISDDEDEPDKPEYRVVFWFDN